MRLSTIEYDFVCKTREHGLFRQKNMFFLLRQENMRTCFFIKTREQKNMFFIKTREHENKRGG